MLIGNILEKTDAEHAWQLCADKLGDWVRDEWLKNTREGNKRWTEQISEDTAALPGLREEGFSDLVGLDYILKWWGADDVEGLAGELDVVWKIAKEEEIVCYRSWVKLAERDFILGLYKEERSKREANREGFRKAFAQWLSLFEKI